MNIRLSCAAILLLFALPAAGAEHTVSLDPDQTNISWTLEATGHNVSGSFRLMSGRITWDDATGTASGAIEIDAASAHTGNKRRDNTMNEDVLEIVRYPKFVFEPSRVEGHVPAEGTSHITLHGSLTIHGGKHVIDLDSEVRVRGGVMKIDAALKIPFVAWGMKDPSIVFLRVAKDVEVTVTATASVSDGP